MVLNYIIVTASYWGFTLVDGALRMLVLFHFSRLGYTPFTLAFLFLLYEAAGVAANLAGGYLASRFGIPRMLTIGQTSSACRCFSTHTAGFFAGRRLPGGLDRRLRSDPSHRPFTCNT